MEKIVTFVQEQINPFEHNDSLMSITLGVTADSSIEYDILHAHEKGVKAMTDFVETRLKKKEVEFHAPLRKLKLNTLADVQII